MALIMKGHKVEFLVFRRVSTKLFLPSNKTELNYSSGLFKPSDTTIYSCHVFQYQFYDPKWISSCHSSH